MEMVLPIRGALRSTAMIGARAPRFVFRAGSRRSASVLPYNAHHILTVTLPCAHF